VILAALAQHECSKIRRASNTENTWEAPQFISVIITSTLVLKEVVGVNLARTLHNRQALNIG
jgi:hypothetical protein